MRRTLRLPAALALALLLLVAPGAPAHAATIWTIHPSTSGLAGLRTRILWANGSTTATFTTTGTANRFTFAADVEYCEGPARLEVRIDGVHLETFDVAGSGSYSVAGDWPAGSHHVSLRFTNDLLTDRCDRNVRAGFGYFHYAYRYLGTVASRSEQELVTESVTISPVTAGRVVPVASWDPTPAVMLWGNGTARGLLDSQGAHTLGVDVRSWRCGDDVARVAIRVDDVEVHRGPVEPWTWRPEGSTIWVERPFADGVHRVEVEFLNDHRDTLDHTCDRNLMVKAVRFIGAV